MGMSTLFRFLILFLAPLAFSEVNGVITTSLLAHGRGCHSLFLPVDGGNPRRHVAAWTASLGPAHRGMGEVDRSAHAWHTLTWLWPAFLPLPPEYKKKYGEEHGSCQAGMSGFFTEVGVSHVAFISFPSGCLVLSILWLGGPGDGISGALGS